MGRGAKGLRAYSRLMLPRGVARPGASSFSAASSLSPSACTGSPLGLAAMACHTPPWGANEALEALTEWHRQADFDPTAGYGRARGPWIYAGARR